MSSLLGNKTKDDENRVQTSVQIVETKLKSCLCLTNGYYQMWKSSDNYKKIGLLDLTESRRDWYFCLYPLKSEWKCDHLSWFMCQNKEKYLHHIPWTHSSSFCKKECGWVSKSVNVILLPKLFWPTVRKNCPSNREKLLKFEAEGREFSKFLISLEQFVQAVKGHNNFW